MPMTQQQRAISGNSPRDLRVNAPQGRIYENDPAAVARLKQMMADTRDTTSRSQPRRQTGIKRAATGIDSDLQQKLDRAKARLAEKKQTAPTPTQPEQDDIDMKQRLTDDDALAAHRRYVVENISVKNLANEMRISVGTLSAAFERLDLPTRSKGGKWTTRGQARCCQLHDLALADVANNAVTAVRPNIPAEPKTGPKTEPKPPRNITRPAPPAPSANGNGAVKEAVTAVAVYSQPAAPTIAPAAGDMGAQIAALQSFLASATAQNVEVTGTIEIQLSAKINF